MGFSFCFLVKTLYRKSHGWTSSNLGNILGAPFSAIRFSTLATQTAFSLKSIPNTLRTYALSSVGTLALIDEGPGNLENSMNRKTTSTGTRINHILTSNFLAFYDRPIEQRVSYQYSVVFYHIYVSHLNPFSH